MNDTVMPSALPADPKVIIAGVKSLRKNITFEAETLKALPKTRETALALTKLEEGCMWLGKELERIGELFPDLLRDPYPTSKDPSVGTIDPPAPEVATPAPSLGDAPVEDPAPKNPNAILNVSALPAIGALTDQQFEIIKHALRGESVPAEEYAAVSAICDMMVWAQAAGLRVASAEDYATARQKVQQASAIIDGIHDSNPGIADQVQIVLDQAKALLDAWTPPQR